MSTEDDRLALYEVIEGLLSGKIPAASIMPTAAEYKEWQLGNRGRAVAMLQARLARYLR